MKIISVILMCVVGLMAFSCHGKSSSESTVVIVDGDDVLISEGSNNDIELFLSDGELDIILNKINRNNINLDDYIDLNNSILKITIDGEEHELIKVVGGYIVDLILSTGEHDFILLICNLDNIELFRSDLQTISVSDGTTNIIFNISHDIESSLSFGSINIMRKNNHKLEIEVGVNNADGSIFRVLNDNHPDLKIKDIETDYPNDKVEFEVSINKSGDYIIILELEKTHDDGVIEVIQKEMSFSESLKNILVLVAQSPKIKKYTITETLNDGIKIALQLNGHENLYDIIWKIDGNVVQLGELVIDDLDGSDDVAVCINFKNHTAITTLHINLN